MDKNLLKKTAATITAAMLVGSMQLPMLATNYRFEAETGKMTGLEAAKDIANDGYSQSGYTAGWKEDSSLEVTVSVEEDQESTLAIGYITAEDAAVTVSVNGKEIGDVALAKPEKAGWAIATIDTKLSKGESTVKLETKSGSGFFIDYVDVAEKGNEDQLKGAYVPDRPNDRDTVTKYDALNLEGFSAYQAEDATPNGGARVNTDHDGFKGTGMVALTRWYGAKAANLPSLSFASVDGYTGGTRKLIIGYDNGHAFAQKLDLYVNDQMVKTIYFPTVQDSSEDSKANWGVFGAITEEVELKAGTNKIELKTSEDSCPTSFNIDFIAVNKDEGWEKEVNKVELVIGSNEVKTYSKVDSGTLTLDVAPMIVDDRTFIPLRGLFEALGGEIEWNGETQEIKVVNGTTTIDLKVGTKSATVNGGRRFMDSAPFIENSRTFIPLRFISEALGYKVDWDAATQKITVTM